MIIARQDGKSMLTLSKLLNEHSNQNRYQRQTRELILSSTQKDKKCIDFLKLAKEL